MILVVQLGSLQEVRTQLEQIRLSRGVIKFQDGFLCCVDQLKELFFLARKWDTILCFVLA